MTAFITQTQVGSIVLIIFVYLFLCYSYGTKLDVWAAGVVTYLVICGSLPFGRYITHTQYIPQCCCEDLV